MTNIDIAQNIQDEINGLKHSLQAAQARLKSCTPALPGSNPHINDIITTQNTLDAPQRTREMSTVVQPHSTQHALLLLSDSALPLGSFAFSSGLESYLAHHKPLTKGTSAISSFHRFLHLSVASLGGTAIPYLLAAYRCPEEIETFDNDLDASTPCTVARRASVAQGRALLSVWERSLRSAVPQVSDVAVRALSAFSTLLKRDASDPDVLGPNGHFAPIWATVCRAMAVDIQQTVYVFLFNHAKAVLGAAVRASVMGPYQAQGVLASAWLQEEIKVTLESNWNIKVENAGQAVPVLDLWVGRHELLYSRIFNS